MPVLTDPEEDQQQAGGDSGQQEGQPEGADRDTALDQQGTQPLSGPESSRLDQISAGLQAAGSFVGTRKKAFLLGGGISGLVIALIFSFLALLPLKLEAMMKNVFSRAIGDRVEYMMEKRSDKFVVGYLESRFGMGGGSSIVADSNFAKSLFNTWRLNKFENKFAENSGIKIEQATDANGKKIRGIKVTTPDGFKSDFTSSDKFEQFLNQDSLHGSQAKKFIQTVTRDQTKWFQVYKRRNLRRFMMNAYGIRKWSFFTGKDGKGAQSEVDNALVEDAADIGAAEAAGAVECALAGDSCPTDAGERDPQSDISGHNDNLGDSTSETGGSGDDKVKNAVSDGYKGAVEETTKEGTKVTSKLLTKLLGEKIGTTVSEAFAKAKGPLIVVTGIDIFSRIDHFFWNGNADKVVAHIHQVQLATQFAEWQTITDNFADPNKQMSGDEFNAVMNKTGDLSKTSSGQASASFNTLFLGKSGGQGLDGDKSISDSQHSIQTFYRTYIGSMIIPAPIPWACTPVGSLHCALDFWRATGGKIWGFVNNTLLGWFNAIIGKILNLFPPFQWFTDHIGEWLTKGVMALVTPSADGTEQNGDLLNNLYGGGTVVGHDYALSLGAHNLSPQAAAQFNQAIALQNDQNKPGLMTRLFSTNYTYSLANQLAIATPTTIQSATGEASGTLMAAVRSPAGWVASLFNNWFSGNSHADAGNNIFGIPDVGYTDQELNQPLQLPDDYNHDGRIDSQDCHYNPDGSKIDDKVFNDPNTGRICLLDVATAQDLGLIINGNQAVDDTDNGGLN